MNAQTITRRLIGGGTDTVARCQARNEWGHQCSRPEGHGDDNGGRPAFVVKEQGGHIWSWGR